MRLHLPLLAAAITCLWPSQPCAQVAAAPAKAGRDFSFVVMPIPVSNPAVGNGLAIGGMALYKVGGSERPWVTAAGGLYTDTRTWGSVVGQKAYFAHDRIRLTAGAGGGVFNTEFFGIGQSAGLRGSSIPIKETGKGGLFEALYRVAPNLYLGPEYRYVNVRTSLDLSQVKFPDQQIPDAQLNSTVSALGLAGEYDTRDSQFGPRHGLYGKVVWLRSARSLGSNSDFDRVEASLNGYHALDEKSVLAWRAALCFTGGGAPFYQLCSFGQQSDLRGYQAGQYIDHAMYAVQAEYRRHLFWRIGAVVFGGVGEVADSFHHLDSRNLLPAGGAGLRLQASKAYDVNVRVDYARGRDGSGGLYFSIGEAF
jgi:outer membrane protein assembly factor BamA